LHSLLTICDATDAAAGTVVQVVRR